MSQLQHLSDSGELTALRLNMPGKADLYPNKHLEVQSACMFVGEPMSASSCRGCK